MSTRAQIEFECKWKDNQGKLCSESRTIYRHSDGYPEGVIPDLKEFLKWNAGRNTDVEYAAANFIYWSKRKAEEKWFKPGDVMSGDRKKWSDVGSTNCSILHTGFGVCNNKEVHGDTAYFYKVISSLETEEKGDITIVCYQGMYDGTYEQLIAQKPLKTVKVKTKEK